MPAGSPTRGLTLLVARAKGGVIGRGNRLPWHLPEDLRHFKATTLGRSLIMGRRTFESIGRPLPGRHTIVLTRDPAWRRDGCSRAASLGEAIAIAGARDEGEIFVVGGEQVYRLALPLADRALITEVDLTVDGDAWFPDLDPSRWREIARDVHTAADGTRFAIVDLHRIDGAKPEPGP